MTRIAAQTALAAHYGFDSDFVAAVAPLGTARLVREIATVLAHHARQDAYTEYMEDGLSHTEALTESARDHEGYVKDYLRAVQARADELGA